MKRSANFILLFFLTFSFALLSGQEEGYFSGGFQSNANFFIRDSLIGASNIPQYDNQKFGAEAWLNLNYSIKGYDMGIRFDLFNNSNLLNPEGSYTDQGIGMWYLGKQVGNLDIRVGYMYDQIGSGLIYRSFEERPQLIDNALVGARLVYHINDLWKLRAFTGKQRRLFSTQDAVIKGFSVDGFFNLGNDNQWSFSPGAGVIGRTLSDETVGSLVSILRNYIGAERVNKFAYNTYAASIYSTVGYKNLSLYLEAAYKTPEVFNHPDSMTTKITGNQVPERYIKEAGNVVYGSLSYGVKGLGITIEAKRTQNFSFRTDPTLGFNNGLINYLPQINRINSYRLTTRYSPATQDISEFAFQIDINYKFNKALSLLLNYSDITKLDGHQLYREFYTDVYYKYKRKINAHVGLQYQIYDQATYYGEPVELTPTVHAVTPFIDVLYKIDRKKSVRVESQYMSTKQDFGSWIFGLVEFGMAPHWQFEASAMYNIKPNPNNENAPVDPELKILYPTLGVVYNYKANRYSLRYVKQVEGIVCSGGICRLEPAFSGLKFQVSSTF